MEPETTPSRPLRQETVDRIASGIAKFNSVGLVDSAPNPDCKVLKPKTVMPDRLALDPKSPFHNAALINRGVGVRFKGTEKRNVAEYCLSEGWVRLIVGQARGRDGNQLAVKLQGQVEVWMRDEVGI